MINMRRHLILTLIVTLGALAGSGALAQERFKTPESAADALAAAARSGDQASLVKVLGPGSKELVSSGDPVADDNTRQLFLAAFDARHSVAGEGVKPRWLIIGLNDWPFPIPLVQQDGEWSFDTASGREEILARRIGRNELAAIQACLAYYDAQNDYADKFRDKAGMAIYAQRIVSSSDKKDGLYWPTAEGEPQSPLGEAVAAATRQGYRVGAGHVPFHGYYYKILTKQGSSARGGAVDYVVRGNMIGGFALVAYPAEYGNSGIMTFIVNNNGDVYEKDLGGRTARIASRMTEFNPDHTWQRVADTEPVK
jgi:hypothetical protein